jgi:hypothetical protein
MADDISKKIIIGVEAQTDGFAQNISSLNKIIDTLLEQQKQLDEAGKKNSETFDSISAKIETFQKRLEDVNKQVTANATALNSSSTAAKANESAIASLTTQLQSNAKATGDSASKAKELGGSISALGQSIKKQNSSVNESKSALKGHAGSMEKSAASAQKLQTNVTQADAALTAQASAVTQNKTSFDAHKATMEALKSSFDKLKGVSGDFGPSLEEAAKGFDSLKSGLEVVKTGFTSVGEAIKTTGFGLLVLVLQSVIDYLTKTKEGSALLKGILSGLGKAIEIVHATFAALGKIIIDAVTHPVESLKALGNLVKENIINRFKAFGVILDGLIHLDFKKMADVVIQSVTGVTNGTEKIVGAFKKVETSAQSTWKEVSKAYTDGVKHANKALDDHDKKVKTSIEKRIGYHDKLLKKIVEANNAKSKSGNRAATDADDPIVAVPSATPSVTPVANELSQTVSDPQLTAAKTEADQTVALKKTAIQQVEDYAKQSAGKLATEALSALNNSIKQQSAAKIAGLEKDKTAELSNNSLTSAQRLAITQKYQQQEGQVKVKAFKEEQEASIAQALINGAIAITKAGAQTGVLASLVIPEIIAQTAIQVATISAQKPPAYAKGGLHYESDGRGGVLSGYSRTDNTNAYLRSGEGIVVSEAMQIPWARNLVSAINVGFGGRDFSISNPDKGYAVGGIFTDGGDANRYYNQPVNDQKNLANTIAYQMINNFPPVYVDVKDVNNQQNILAQTINRVNL